MSSSSTQHSFTLADAVAALHSSAIDNNPVAVALVIPIGLLPLFDGGGGCGDDSADDGDANDDDGESRRLLCCGDDDEEAVDDDDDREESKQGGDECKTLILFLVVNREGFPGNLERPILLQHARATLAPLTMSKHNCGSNWQW